MCGPLCLSWLCVCLLYVHIRACVYGMVWPVNHLYDSCSEALAVHRGPGVSAEVVLCPAGGAPYRLGPRADSGGCPPRPARARPAALGYKFAPCGWPATPHRWSDPECPAAPELSPPLAWSWPRVSAWEIGSRAGRAVPKSPEERNRWANGRDLAGPKL